MSINFRQQARDALFRANEELKSKTQERLKYAALELRMAMESLTYDRAQTYKNEIPPDEYKTWQPRKLLLLLLEIDPNADKGSGLSYGVEEKAGTAAEKMTGLGFEKVLNVATIKKHYDALGAFLHVPTLKQIDEDIIPDLEKLRIRCLQIAHEVEITLASPIWNINFGSFSDILCSRCNNPIRKRLVTGTTTTKATCFKCNASYDLSKDIGGKVTWKPQQQEVTCQEDGCSKIFVIWNCDIKPESNVSCPHCSTMHYIGLSISNIPSEH